MNGIKEKYLPNLSKKSEYLAFIVLAFMISSYIFIIANSAVNCSVFLDDSKIFFNQFIQNYIQADTFLEKLKFLCSISNHPHPKISARLFCIFNYTFFDQVNLRAAQIISSLFTLGLFFVIGRFVQNNKLLLLLIASLLFIPLSNNFWPISAISLPFLFLISLIAIITFIDKKYIISTIATLLTMFSSGQGFLIFVILFAYSLLNLKSNFSSRQFYVWLISSLIGFIYLIILIQNSPFATQNSQQFFVFDSFTRRTSYLLKFFSSGYIRLWELFFSKSLPNSLSKFSVITQGFSLLAICHVLYHSIKVKLKFNRHESIAICFFAFFVSIGLLAAFVKTPNDFDTIYPRYYIWSFYFLIAYLMFFWSIGYLPRKIKPLIILGSIIISLIYLGRLSRTFSRYNKPQVHKCVKLEDTLMRKRKNVKSENVKKIEMKRTYDIKAIDLGIYKPPINVDINKVKQLKQKK